MNKVLLTVKCMKIHRNLSRGLIPIQKQLLCRSCVLLIILYSFQLWYYSKAPLAYLLKELRKMQRRAIIWIFRAFRISSSLSIEAVVGLISIHLHLQKLSSRFQLRIHTLPQNHIVKSLLELRHINDSNIHQLSLERIMPKQQLLLKEPIVDTNNRLNRVFPSLIYLVVNSLLEIG